MIFQKISGAMVSAMRLVTKSTFIQFLWQSSYSIANCHCTIGKIFGKRLMHSRTKSSYGLVVVPIVVQECWYQKERQTTFDDRHRQLNEQTVKSCWPNPSIEIFFEKIEGSAFFSTIDVSWDF